MTQRYLKGPNRLVTMHVDEATLEPTIVAISVLHKGYEEFNAITSTDMHGARLQLGGKVIEKVALQIAEDIYDLRNQLESERCYRDDMVNEDRQRDADIEDAMRDHVRDSHGE